MPGEVFKKLKQPGMSTYDLVEHISTEAGLLFRTFDETHIHFEIINSKKLLMFLLKI